MTISVCFHKDMKVNKAAVRKLKRVLKQLVKRAAIIESRNTERVVILKLIRYLENNI